MPTTVSKTNTVSGNLNNFNVNGNNNNENNAVSKKSVNQKFYLQQRRNRNQAIAGNAASVKSSSETGVEMSEKNSGNSNITHFKRTVFKASPSKFTKPSTPENGSKRSLMQTGLPGVWQMDENKNSLASPRNEKSLIRNGKSCVFNEIKK